MTMRSARKWRLSGPKRVACAAAAIALAATLVAIEPSPLAASQGQNQEDLAAFERAKEAGGSFGSAIVGLPKDLCLSELAPNFGNFWRERREPIPILIEPGGQERVFHVRDWPGSLFQICRVFSTGLDD